MTAYNGFTEPQDVIEARKARILGKTAQAEIAEVRVQQRQFAAAINELKEEYSQSGRNVSVATVLAGIGVIVGLVIGSLS